MTSEERTGTARIARAEAIHVRVPFRRPFLDATGEFTHRSVWLLRVVDGEGREGFGEAVLHPAAAEASTVGLDALMRELVPALADGRPPLESDLLAEGEPGRAALAALSGALAGLDAGAGAGAGERTVAVVATIAFGGPDAGAEAAAQAVELGFTTLKLRAGYERETSHLVDRVRAIRGAIGPEPKIRVEVAGAWDLDTAAERIRAIERFRIEFVAQPLAAWNTAGHAVLREQVDVQIALDEAVESEGAAGAAIAEQAAGLLILRPARLGGAGPTLRIARRAAQAGIEVALGGYFETGVGIAAALRIAGDLPGGMPSAGLGAHGDGHAHDLAGGGVLVHDLLAHPLPIERGRMAIPRAIAADEDELDRRATERVAANAS